MRPTRAQLREWRELNNKVMAAEIGDGFDLIITALLDEVDALRALLGRCLRLTESPHVCAPALTQEIKDALKEGSE